MKLFIIVCSFLMSMGLSAAETESAERLSAVLGGQPEAVKARYKYRHPQQTMEFFGVQKGMTVVEALPGSGWYSKILMPLLGEQGTLIGADYPIALYSNFGFMNAERLKAKETWVQDWATQAQAWEGEEHASINAFVLGALPEALNGTADVVLFIRATHNLARFSFKDDFLEQALKSAYDALKPGGIMGVVQHRAPEAATDEWASGKNGYLKQSFVIAKMQEAGFELLETSEINANPKDKPSAEDFVWRLPPSSRTSGDDAEMKAKMDAIGESDRMTLKFVKR